MKHRLISRTDLSLLIVVFIWGINYSVVKAALHHFSPLSFNGLRFLIASFVLFLILSGSEKSLPKFGKDWIGVLGVGFLGNFVYQLLFIFGMNLTLAGNVSLILATTPVFVAMFSHLAGHEKVNSRMWLGILVSFIGIVFVVGGGKHVLGIGSKSLKGDLIEFAAAVLWSAYIVASAPLIKRYGAIATSASTLWTGTIFLFGFSLPSIFRQDWSMITMLDWGALLFSAIFPIAIGQIIWYRGIREIGNARTSIYSNLTPLIGLFIAWPLLGETPRLLQLTGGACIISAIFLTGIKSGSPAGE